MRRVAVLLALLFSALPADAQELVPPSERLTEAELDAAERADGAAEMPGGDAEPAASEPLSDEPEPVPEAVGTTATIPTEAPTEWMPSRGRECYRRGRNRGFCEGPRRTPRPLPGPDTDRARALHLGGRDTPMHIMRNGPRPEWVAECDTEALPTLLWPIEGGRPGRGFGYVRTGRNRDRPHLGVDIFAPGGHPFRAANGGLVAYADNGVSGYGNLVIVVHADGTTTHYAHARAIYVFPGQRVVRGQVLGEVGDTGFARGTHVHFEWRAQGRAMDPGPYFSERPERAATQAEVDDEPDDG